MDFLVVIPARLKSSRLKEKLLIRLRQKEILARTFAKCLVVVPKNKIIIATDSRKIVKLCKRINANYILIKKRCLTGTDRVAEVAKKIKKEYYINVQGDEPFLDTKDLKRLIKSLNLLKKVDVINGYSEIKNKEDYMNSSIPKVVFNKNDELMYMSRSPIPSSKILKFNKSYRQICLYAFKRKALLEFKNNKKTELENNEDIEILRFVEKGYKVKMIKMSGKSFAIDTNYDLKKARKFLKKNK
mgnify:CR=1 FL=1